LRSMVKRGFWCLHFAGFARTRRRMPKAVFQEWLWRCIGPFRAEGRWRSPGVLSSNLFIGGGERLRGGRRRILKYVDGRLFCIRVQQRIRGRLRLRRRPTQIFSIWQAEKDCSGPIWQSAGMYKVYRRRKPWNTPVIHGDAQARMHLRAFGCKKRSHRVYVDRRKAIPMTETRSEECFAQTMAGRCLWEKVYIQNETTGRGRIGK